MEMNNIELNRNEVGFGDAEPLTYTFSHISCDFPD